MFGGLALLLAAGAAFWVLYRASKGGGAAAGGQKRAVFLLKLVVWLGIAAGLLAAKLLPLALMVLLAAGGVTASGYGTKQPKCPPPTITTVGVPKAIDTCAGPLSLATTTAAWFIRSSRSGKPVFPARS